jgi:hypothetical protein
MRKGKEVLSCSTSGLRQSVNNERFQAQLYLQWFCLTVQRFNYAPTKVLTMNLALKNVWETEPKTRG